jgi:hypothetical protein
LSARPAPTLGALLKDTRRIRIYKNANGELLLQPVIEIPAAEGWLFHNQEARQAVQKGLKEAAEGAGSPGSIWTPYKCSRSI